MKWETFEKSEIRHKCKAVSPSKPTLGARSFLREESRSAISEAVKREKIDEVRKPLVARDS